MKLSRKKKKGEKNKDLHASIRHAADGICYAFGKERKLKFALCCIAPAVFLGFYFGLSPLEWGFGMLAGVLIVALEMVNTALEAVVDMVMPQLHPLAKVAKDVAAGAVFLAVIVSVSAVLLMFIPKIIAEYR